MHVCIVDFMGYMRELTVTLLSHSRDPHNGIIGFSRVIAGVSCFGFLVAVSGGRSRSRSGSA